MNPLETGNLIAQTIISDHRIHPSEPADLALVGLLYLYDAAKKEEYLSHVLKVWDFREENNSANLNVKVFCSCLHFETWLRTGNIKFISGFEDTAAEWKTSVLRDDDGSVCYGVIPENKKISVSLLQGFSVFMARAGFLTGNEAFYEECVNQYELYRKNLRDPATGLWHESKNWNNNPGKITPVHSNRSQGWVLRGLVDSMDWLPKDSGYFSRLKAILNEFCNDLIRYQDPRGMWHQLTNLEEAYQETSGTALFVHYLYKGFHRGWLDRNPYLTVAESGITALLGFVREDGCVLNTSHYTGPIPDNQDYLHSPSIPGDPWSIGPVLMACAGPWMAREPGSMVKL